MIKAQDIKHGNIVSISRHKDNPVRLCDGWLCHVLENEGHQASIYPIKLTLDWLHRLGFSDFTSRIVGHRKACRIGVGEEYEHTVYNFGDGYLFFEDEDSDSWSPLNTKSIEYVHELQNLFYALTGIDLGDKVPLV